APRDAVATSVPDPRRKQPLNVAAVEYSARRGARPPVGPTVRLLGYSAKPCVLLAEFVERRAEAGKAVALLLDDRPGRAGNETFVRELRLRLRDLAFMARNVLRNALAFGHDVDLDVQHQPVVADDLYRRIAGWQCVHDAHVGELRERREIRRERLERGTVAGRNQRDLLRRRQSHFAAQRAACVDDVL